MAELGDRLDIEDRRSVYRPQDPSTVLTTAMELPQRPAAVL